MSPSRRQRATPQLVSKPFDRGIDGAQLLAAGRMPGKTMIFVYALSRESSYARAIRAGCAEYGRGEES
jgi:hypothetical protein